MPEPHGIQGWEWAVLCLILFLAFVIYGRFDREHREQQTSQIERWLRRVYVKVQENDLLIEKRLLSITQKLEKMPTLSEFEAWFDKLEETLTEIDGDLEEIKNQLAGGLTAAEGQKLADRVATLQSKMRATADVVPEAPAPPEEPEG